MNSTDGMIDGIIYMIVSPSGRMYIGQTINLKRRIKEYSLNNSNFKKQRMLYNDCIKYGYEVKNNIIIIDKIRFNRDVRDKFGNNELDRLEIYYIEKYDTYKNGMNLNMGGGSRIGYRMTDEQKLKISNSNKNKKRTKEQRERISRSRTGLKLSEEVKSKMNKRLGKDHPMFNKTHSDETKEKISKSLSNKRYFNKSNQYMVICFKGNEFIGIYTSLSECSYDVFGYNNKNLYRVVIGIRKSYKGYVIKRLSDFLPFPPQKIIIKK